MVSLHGIFEWIFVLLMFLAGFAADRFLPARRPRYMFYAVLLLTAFIFDLNGVIFRADVLNAVWYAVILLVIAEIFWKCVRKRSRPLLCGAFVLIPPTFLFIFAAALLYVPMPCHKRTNGLVESYADCDGGAFSLSVRQSFDPFKPGRIYSLSKDIRLTPLKRRIDRFSVPPPFAGTRLTTRWECAEGGLRAYLYADKYILWTLCDKTDDKTCD